MKRAPGDCPRMATNPREPVSSMPSCSSHRLTLTDAGLGSKSSDGQTISSSHPRSGATAGSRTALDEMVWIPRDFPVSVTEEREYQ